MRMALMLAAVALTAAPAAAQDSAVDPEQAALEGTFTYRQGDVALGDGLAVLHVPAGFRYLGPDDAKRLLEDGWYNPPGDAPLGMLIPVDASPFSDEGWGVVITFEEDGYVEDDDASTIDFDELLADMQSDVRDENEARKEAGYESIALVGWAAPPHYDAASHKLYWAQELKFGEEDVHTLNYNIRVLGRRGVLVLNAVAYMDQLALVERDLEPLLAGIEFNDGHRYADYIPGTDKLATYGIAGLIAGKVAMKVGLFKLLIGGLIAMKKFVIVGVVGLVAVTRRVMGRGKVAEG